MTSSMDLRTSSGPQTGYPFDRLYLKVRINQLVKPAVQNKAMNSTIHVSMLFRLYCYFFVFSFLFALV